jgi:hypothetical protein
MRFSEVTELEPPQMLLGRHLDGPRSFRAFDRLLKREAEEEGTTAVSFSKMRRIVNCSREEQ